MDMSVSSGVTHMLTQQKVGDAVGVQVTRKALDIQSQNVMSLVNSVSQSGPSKGAASQPHLGNMLDVHA